MILFQAGGRLNVFSAVELQLKVNTLKDNNTVIVTAKKGKEVLGEAKADSSGKFTAKINKVQSAGSLLNVTESDATGTAKTSLKTIVKKGDTPIGT